MSAATQSPSSMAAAVASDQIRCDKRSRTTRRHAWAVAALVLASAIAGDAVQSRLPCGGGDLIQALQFADSRLLVMRMVPAGSPINHAAIEAYRLDTILFVPSYWLVFTSAGLLLMRTGWHVDRLLAAAIIAAATGAAVFDIVENRLIGAALANSDDFRSPIAWATAKWTLAFGAILCVSLALLLRLKQKHQSRTLGIVAGALLLAGSAAGLHVVRGPSWLAATSVLSAIGLLLLALSFIWDPEYLFETVPGTAQAPERR